MTSPCDHDGLWMKARVHINRSFTASEASEFEESALWSASALELLAKAALAKVSPLLVADPTDDGRSLLVAAGLSADAARFKSITAKALFSRCARAFPPFDEREGDAIARMRNEELHSALSPFTGIDQDRWWQRYWAQAAILVDAQHETIEEFVGSERTEQVEACIHRNAENVERRVQAMLKGAARRWAAASSSADATAEIARLVSRVRMHEEFEFHAWDECPACEEPAHLYGDYVEDSHIDWSPEELGPPIETLSVVSEGFECESCGLQLRGAAYLSAAGVSQSFEEEREYEPEWDDYGND